NGAGKTTTIRMLLRIIPPDSGSVLFDGEPFGEAARDRIGYLPEERGLYRKSRLLDTVLYFSSLRGMKIGDARPKALAWTDRLGLSGLVNARLEELSKGNQQKVQFIIAVLHDPEFIVLDEPFSGLDPINQTLLNDILGELRRQGRAIVFSTHVMDQADRLCDDLCLIDGGTAILNGPLDGIRAGFGRETVSIEFSGDGAALDAIPMIRVVGRYGNSAEVVLLDPSRSRELLAVLAARLEIRKFEIRTPSLNTIFLESVRGRHRSAEGGTRP
ncbi:MAG TPA: ATP-binding cassette domain-containing protein, partial [Bacteroidota bacterium]|nr:ATP-binding cassette domain-containing protein [Bacteroidota bacterium]